MSPLRQSRCDFIDIKTGGGLAIVPWVQTVPTFWWSGSTTDNSLKIVCHQSFLEELRSDIEAWLSDAFLFAKLNG